MFDLHSDQIGELCRTWALRERNALKGRGDITQKQIFNLMDFDFRGLTTSDGVKAFEALLVHDLNDDVVGRIEELYTNIIQRYGRFCVWLNYRCFRYALKTTYQIPGWMIRRLYKKYPYIWLIPTLQSGFRS